jgi:ABC-2 type transport system permease protein
MFSAFQALNAEGQALWILYTVPKSLPSILREKALL